MTVWTDENDCPPLTLEETVQVIRLLATPFPRRWSFWGDVLLALVGLVAVGVMVWGLLK